MNRRHVVEAQEQVQQALFDYTLNCYTQIPVSIIFYFIYSSLLPTTLRFHAMLWTFCFLCFFLFVCLILRHL